MSDGNEQYIRGMGLEPCAISSDAINPIYTVNPINVLDPKTQRP